MASHPSIYNDLDLRSLIDEWKFWDSQKARCDSAGLSKDEADSMIVILNALIRSKTLNQEYLSLPDVNGEPADWFKSDSWG
ncbi:MULTISPECIES: hypothetical protein [unclassified Rhizobium]|uniref:hypothetical protein n=1 Tax=unclassified Rhizobium TaxID=2613769 RepID=UPI00161F85AB|nr:MULTISPECIES: hypothetical protein [unclassified Rhizobium]MBB3387005.1 hypothetical protein [Rhizobium sp. BK098]MBB3618672.1 hypothetical protein [Rhizobium sp. BK609]MBB3684366.1 hypothetical protein [Rhizobium sp. BK612]